MRIRAALGAVLVLLVVGCFAIASPPSLPGLDVSIEACEKRRELCAYVLYHLGKSDPARGESYANRGCESHDMTSCFLLGKHYLARRDTAKAWPVLAAACFVNHNVACHELREHGLSLPPVLSPKPDYGPGLRSNYAGLDAALIDSQRLLKSCYDRRQEAEGMLEFAVTFSGGKPAVTLLRSTMNADFTTCIVDQLGALSAPGLGDQTFQRTLQYFNVYTMALPNGLKVQ